MPESFHAEVVGQTVVSTLLMTDLVGSTKLVEELGDARAAEIFTAQDRLARDLLPPYGGREIDKTDGFLILFARPVDAVQYVLAYHTRLAELSEAKGVTLEARAGIHLGELIIHENTPEDVERGAKPVEVEGIAKPLAARIMSLAQGRQTLMTQGAFDLARRAVVGNDAVPAKTAWMAHGPYLVKGYEEPVEVFEVGVEEIAPLRAPPDSEKARRSVAASDEETLGWRPAAGLEIPQRKGWELDHKLGEGGFGEVWLGVYRQTGEERVFKFCFSAEHLRSLKRELTLFRLLRDALGDRKDIARMYEVQLEEPPFFLESEFTPSGSLLEWAEKRGGIDQVPIETRIDLLARTARAVAAAHSVGIVHKDIKPGNVLIYEDEDGAPRPRLADFGIGALTDQEKLVGGNITMAGFTSAMTSDSGSQAGTRMYAPPETLAGKPFTAMGDVYALGVMLFQMAAGDLNRPIAQGWERAVPGPLIREDIAISIEGNEDQRGSAQGLAKRLEALPERRRAFKRRQRGRLAVLVVSVLAVLGVVAMGLALREGALRQLAVKEANKAKTIAALIQEMIASPDAWDKAGVDVRVVEVLDRAAAEFETKLDDQPEVKAALLHTLGRTYRQLSLNAKARACLEPALALRESVLDPPHEEIAESLTEWAELLFAEGDFAGAEPYYRRALEMRTALASDGTDRSRLRLAESTQHVAAWLNKVGRPTEAEPLYREALALRRELLPPSDRDVGRSLNNLGICLRNQRRFGEAEKFIADALAIFLVLHGDRPHAEVAGALSNRGRCKMELGALDEARALLERAVPMKREVWPAGHTSTAISLQYLGEVLLKMDDTAAAEARLRESYELRRRLLGPGHPATARTESLLGECLLRLDRPSEAPALLVLAYPVLSKSSGATPEEVRETLDRLVRVSEMMNEPEEAQRYRSLMEE